MYALHRWPKLTIRFIIVVRCTPVSRAVDAEGVALNQVVKDFDLLFTGKYVAHSGIPFCWGSPLEWELLGRILAKAGL